MPFFLEKQKQKTKTLETTVLGIVLLYFHTTTIVLSRRNSHMVYKKEILYFSRKRKQLQIFFLEFLTPSCVHRSSSLVKMKVNIEAFVTNSQVMLVC